MENTVRWTIKVSPETDIALRTFLAQQGGRKGDLSRFVEEAVRARLFERMVAQVKERNADLPPEELQAIIDEAVIWARTPR